MLQNGGFQGPLYWYKARNHGLTIIEDSWETAGHPDSQSVQAASSTRDVSDNQESDSAGMSFIVLNLTLN